MQKISVVLGLILAIGSISISQASEINYDYLDVARTSQKLAESSPDFDGYSLDFSYGLGSHYAILLEFDNVQAERDSWENRIKTRSFGLGYHNSITRNIDFVAQYTKQKIHDTETEVIGNSIIQWRYHDRGDTTKLGLRGEAFDNIEWDAFAVRKTIKGDGVDFDKTGVELGVRYFLLSRLSIGLSLINIDDREQTAMSFRYLF